MGRMRRRDVLGLAGSLAIVWPPAAGAQQGVPVIGFLNTSSAAAWASNVAAFRQGLAEAGYAEGKNVAVEYRWADGDQTRLPALAADLVLKQVAVIVATGGPPPIRAAMAATKTIPIVFTSGADPIEQGFVTSLNRPGGNATGVTLVTGGLVAKRLQLLRELVPDAAKIALLVNPRNPSARAISEDARVTAPALGSEILVVRASRDSEFEGAFVTVVAEKAAALLVVADPLFEARRVHLVDLARRHAVPVIYQWREDVEAGGLMSYGTQITEMYREAGVYAAKILGGAKPADLPVQQPTRFELVINLKVAKALGLTIPPTLLARADEVIE